MDKVPEKEDKPLDNEIEFVTKTMTASDRLLNFEDIKNRKDKGFLVASTACFAYLAAPIAPIFTTMIESLNNAGKNSAFENNMFFAQARVAINGYEHVQEPVKIMPLNL